MRLSLVVNRRSSTSKRSVAATLAVFVLTLTVMGLGFAGRAEACDTPVYRYAMYRWPASNYYVFFVHQNEATPAQREVNEALVEIERAAAPKPNVVFFEIDADEIDLAPPIAADHYRKIGRPESTYIVVAPPPLGGVVWAGDLSMADLRSLVASPLRTQIANQLEAGAATVFVLLENDLENDKTQTPKTDKPQTTLISNAEAARITADIVERVNAGQVTLYAAPQPGEPEEALKPEHQIAMVKLRRDDPNEQWLVRMLLAVESDLEGLHQPMVFPVYGRGRVHPPFLSLGISEDNLLEAVQFVTGACSCTVKEQNPGVDLLMDYDWESAALAMAERFGAEEGNEQLAAADLFPQLIIPGGDQVDDAADPTATVSSEAGDSNSNVEGTADPTVAATANGEGEAASTESDDEPEAVKAANGSSNVDQPTKNEGEAEEVQVAARTDFDEELATDVGSLTSIWAVGGVLLIALAGLFIATFVILRPR